MAQVRWTGKRLGKHRPGDVILCSESDARFYERFKFAKRIDEATGEVRAPASPVQTREMKAEEPSHEVAATKVPSKRRYRRTDLQADDT